MDLENKTLLLTGGTGSFGTAFIDHVRQRFSGLTIRVFSRDELKQSELHKRFGDDGMRYFIGDIRDRDRLIRACQGVDVVIHAAAMKQVPACEYNPSEAVATNVIGAQNLVDAATTAGVERVIALSTDKAVNPVNLYGATKLCMEKTIVQGNAYAGAGPTRLACVRYGNVVGSRGSVVPLFREQAATGRITITDPRMTRFWIALSQAVDVVLFALTNATGGEIFVPKLPSMKVTDLAAAMAPDAEIDVIGIRPGEKLHEAMLTVDESHHTVDVGEYFVVLPEHPWWVDQPAWMEGKPLDEGFSYSSDSNDWWLTVPELRSLIG